MENELFKIFLTGIFIFAFQQTFVELWIKPLKSFNEILKRLESFLIKYAYLSQLIWGQNQILDEELKNGKDKLREYAGDLIAGYTRLFFLEKIWFECFERIDVKRAKKSLIRLSNYLGNQDSIGGINLRVEASEAIDEIRKYLKFDLSD